MTVEVLNAALTKEQKDAGFYLTEPNDHVVELRQRTGSVLVATFTLSATIETIRAAADAAMKE